MQGNAMVVVVVVGGRGRGGVERGPHDADIGSCGVGVGFLRVCCRCFFCNLHMQYLPLVISQKTDSMGTIDKL